MVHQAAAEDGARRERAGRQHEVERLGHVPPHRRPYPPAEREGHTGADEDPHRRGEQRMDDEPVQRGDDVDEEL